ncbi:TauD/TfdA family dioxygenase [Mucilaginibacter sp. P25]|uniref:TauD/TfdA family dioxygenase n=1 Tax=Mucilaginibacter sp. P25 TaxID=3423945 RepID=UPI003D78CE6E
MKPSNENETPIIDYFNKQGHSDNQQLPLIIRPQDAQMDLSKWVVVNHEKFTADLVKYGAILFRNFSIKTPGDFKLFLDNFNSEPLPYMFRSSPREQLNQSIKNIYLSTTYPNNRKIYLHNESSYSRVWGGKIVFCCLKPADIGGETPLADSRKVLKSISSDLIDKFKKRCSIQKKFTA